MSDDKVDPSKKDPANTELTDDELSKVTGGTPDEDKKQSDAEKTFQQILQQLP